MHRHTPLLQPKAFLFRLQIYNIFFNPPNILRFFLKNYDFQTFPNNSLFYPKKNSTFAIFNVGALRATPLQ
jgi:hypothetical protein